MTTTDLVVEGEGEIAEEEEGGWNKLNPWREDEDLQRKGHNAG